MSHQLIALFFKFGKFLSLTPSSANNENPDCLQKIYETLVFCLYTGGFIITKYYTWDNYSNLTSIQLVLVVLGLANQFFYIFYILVIVMRFKRKSWFKLIQNLGMVQDETKLKFYYITIGVAYLIFASALIFHVYLVVVDLGWESLWIYLIQYFENYVTFFYSLFVIIILTMLLGKYKQQDVTLLQITKARNLLYSKQVVTILKKAKSNVFTLKESTDTFNDIFGWIILCNIFDGSAKTLIYIDMIIKKDVSRQNRSFFLNDNLWLVIIWVI